MDVFETQAYPQLLRFEGNFSQVTGDPGGRTVYGIAENENPEMFVNGPPTKEAAMAWTRKNYWDSQRLEGLPPAVSIRLFIFAFNTGGAAEKPALKALQKALNRCGEDLDVDGIMGDATHTAVTIAAVAQPENLLARLRAEFCDYHVWKVIQDPKKYEFLEGWLWRDCW